MARSRTGSSILVITLVLFAFTASAWADKSDWADVIDQDALRASKSPTKETSTKPDTASRTKSKASRPPKRVAAKSKTKARKHGKRPR